MKLSPQPPAVALSTSRVGMPGSFPLVACQAADINDSARRFGLWFTLVVVVIRYSGLHEALSYYGGSNGGILYMFSIPALICLLISGGLRRTFSARVTFYWLGFIVFLFLSVPLSTWKGDSLRYALTYVRAELPMLLLLGGMPVTWNECRRVFYSIAIAGIAWVSFYKLFGVNSGGRAGLAFGSQSNSNDFAAILVLLLPFVVFLILCPMNLLMLVRILTQLAGLAALGYGVYLILASGSRGALLAIGVMIVAAFIKGKAMVRTGLILAVPLAAFALPAFLPRSIVNRLGNFSTKEAATEEAAASAIERQRVMKASLHDTLTHPFVGVGAGQFGNYEGDINRRGSFTHAHNTFTQISSEVGIPGGLCYLAATIQTFILLQRIWKSATPYAQLKQVRTACFCISLSYVGFCTAIFFLNFGYSFFLPSFTGMITCLSGAVKREIDSLGVYSVPSAVTPAMPIRGPDLSVPFNAAASAASKSRTLYGSSF